MKKLTTFLPIFIDIFLSTLAAGPDCTLSMDDHTTKAKSTTIVVKIPTDFLAKKKGTNKLDESNNINFEYNSLVSTEKQGQNAVPDCISSIQNQSIVKNDKNKIDFMLKIEAQDNRLLEEANNRYNYYMGVSLGFLALALVYVFFTHTKLKNMYYLV